MQDTYAALSGDEKAEVDELLASCGMTPVLTATLSRRMRVRLADSEEAEARIKGKRLKPVCGDRVTVEAIEGESDWLITSILGRHNELTRPNLRGAVEKIRERKRVREIDYT